MELERWSKNVLKLTSKSKGTPPIPTRTSLAIFVAASAARIHGRAVKSTKKFGH